MLHNFQHNDFNDLKQAKILLENPGFVAKITNVLGTPIEKGLEYLPKDWNTKVVEVTQAALSKAAHAAIFTMKDAPFEKASNVSHQMAVLITGGAGGAGGLPALTIELPLSTTIMLRSIADIARSEGERVSDIETKVACIEVFALSGQNKSDDASKSAYFTTRTALAKAVTEATEYIVERGLAKEGAPPLLRFITQIAERFSIQVSEKAVAQAIPIIGAAAGALINLLFLNHFQDMARGHFIVRRLEKKYGKVGVKTAYENMV